MASLLLVGRTRTTPVPQGSGKQRQGLGGRKDIPREAGMQKQARRSYRSVSISRFAISSQ